MKSKIVAPTPDEDLDVGELPEGWNYATVGELSEAIQYGYTASAIQNSKGPRLLRITDIQNGNVIWDSVPSCEITNDNLLKYELKTGDIVFARTGATTGKSFLIQSCPNAVFASYLIRIRPNEKVDPHFLILFFQTRDYWRMILENVAGIAQPNCNASKLKKLPIPLPPLAEQQRIVSRVEALLTHINAAHDRLSRVPLIMKRFRQGVLAAACSGRLTEGWREENPDGESGAQLLERLIERRKKIKKVGKTFEDDTFFEKFPELPSTWTWSTIQQTAERVTVGHVGPMKNEYRSEGIPFLRCQNVRENYFDSRGLVYISPQFHESLKKSALEPGDLVVVRSGNVGVCCIIPESLTEANCSDLVVVKKPFGFVPKFGAYYVNSLAQKWIDLGTVGIALSHFNTKSVATLPIPIPPLAEQHEIVSRVGLLFERADAFDHEVVAASRRCERLTQAVLAKAFVGKL